LELYAAECEELAALCPRPVPPALRLARLSLIARMDPLLLSAVTGAEEDIAEHLCSQAAAAVAENSRGKCSVCGREAVAAWEDWRYIVDADNMTGKAVFVSVKPVCERCLQALNIHLLPEKEKRKAIKWLAKINKVKKEKAEELVVRILDEYHLLATRVRKWSLDMTAAEKLGIDPLVSKVALEKLTSEMFDADQRYFRVRNTRLAPSLITLAEEDLNLLCSHAIDGPVLAARAMRAGLSPSWEALEEYVALLHDRHVCDMPVNKAIEYLRGAWVIRLGRRQRARLVEAYLSRLLEDKLVWINTLETELGPVEEPEARAYLHTFITIDVVKKAAAELAEMLREAGVRVARLSFRPYIPGRGLLPLSLYSYTVA